MRILIVRLGSMGDIIHALPAVAALRDAMPDAYIGWAIERRWTPLLVADEAPLSGPRSPQRPLVDAVHVVNTLAWRRAPFSDETWAEMRNALRAIRAEKYDIAIDFQGAIKSAVVARLSGAATRIGFAQPREKQATLFYTATVRTAAAHVIDQNLSLVSELPGVAFHRQTEIVNRQRPPASAALCSSASSALNVFPYDPAAERSVWDRVPSAGSATSIAILTPGAGWGAKQWPPARYADVARALANDGVRSLVNYSPAEEALAREVEQASAGAATPVLCTISELIALTRRAALFIGGDTGPMHLANALGVPVVALFGPTEPARTGPYPPMRSEIGNQKSESVGEVPGKTDLADAGNAIVLRHPASRTDRRHRPEPDPGLLQISGDEVISAARELLTANPGTRHPTRDPRHPDAQSPNPNAHSPEPLS